MYTVEEIIGLADGYSPNEVWNGNLACLLVNARQIMANKDFEGASVFSFVLVRRGHLSLEYKGQRIDLKKNDMHTYAPGMPTRMLDTSSDYEGFCLIIEEKMVAETPLMHHFVRTAYFPITELSQPKITLTDEQADQMAGLLLMLRQHIYNPSTFQREALYALCEVFSIDLLNIQNMMVENHRVTTRAEEIFTAFLQLLPTSYMEHHDLHFYAERLNITTTYLSRIVKQISGRTVMDFIEHSLATEAIWRLKTTDRSITQLANEFHFSDQAAFTKFFTRMKGIPPREFRKNQLEFNQHHPVVFRLP
ncbi:MAG: helix-turn-helix transcriptional regulator [Tannerella sp.]|jgi:AraC-like DNA-binding protein|nr:helix-turn-helix transcriptional regulator [Tannerella sp.]